MLWLFPLAARRLLGFGSSDHLLLLDLHTMLPRTSLPVSMMMMMMMMMMMLSLVVPSSSLVLSRPQFFASLISTAAGASPPLPPSSTPLIKDPRGFSYSVLAPPTSNIHPVRGQTVKCDYTLTLKSFDGPDLIDSSRGFMGSPLSFPVGVGQVRVCKERSDERGNRKGTCT